MTPQEINVAVAEELGWKFNSDGSKWAPDGTGYGSWMDVVPEFTEDLNACAEMEKTLTIEERERFAVFLDIRCGDDYHEGRKHWSARPTHATAPQRCESFLRVRSRWTTA